MPGQLPRIVLEPWEEVFETSHHLYQGDHAQVFRIWGRRRLQMLRRMLPYLDTMEIHLLGSGMPSFYVLRCGAMTLTFGLTGFTASNWAATLGFDALLPRGQEDRAVLAHAKKLVTHLAKTWAAPASELEAALGFTPAELRAAARLAIQQGQLMVDFGIRGYRARPLPDAIDLDTLVHRSPMTRQAHDLLQGKGGSVTLESVENIPGFGTRYVADVAIEEDQRTYRCEMTIDKEGRAKKIDDTSPFFQNHQLKEGPSVPLIALRLKIAQVEEELAAQSSDHITAQTRTYVRRQDHGEEVVELSFDARALRVHWGQRTQKTWRAQRLNFNSLEEARAAYFERVHQLEEKGYMDASAT